MLVIDFVCGIELLATAAAFSTAIGKAAKKDILIKKWKLSQTVGGCETVVAQYNDYDYRRKKPIICKKLNAPTVLLFEEVVYHTALFKQTSTHPLAHAIFDERSAKTFHSLTKSRHTDKGGHW